MGRLEESREEAREDSSHLEEHCHLLPVSLAPGPCTEKVGYPAVCPPSWLLLLLPEG